MGDTNVKVGTGNTGREEVMGRHVTNGHGCLQVVRWSSLQDVRIMRGADVGSDHHLLMANVGLKINKVKKGKCATVRFEVSKLRHPEMRNTFKLDLHNRFECLQQLEEEELLLDDEWRQIEQGYLETCEKVLVKAKLNKKDWISKKTWETIESRKEANNAVNMGN